VDINAVISPKIAAIGSSSDDLGLITDLMSIQISRLYASGSTRHRANPARQGRRSGMVRTFDGNWVGTHAVYRVAIGSSSDDLGLITDLMSTQISRLYASETIRHRRIPRARGGAQQLGASYSPRDSADFACNSQPKATYLPSRGMNASSSDNAALVPATRQSSHNELPLHPLKFAAVQ
jgi:hypothetical protein